MTDGIWAGDQAVGTLLLEVESLDPPFGGPALAHGDLHIWHPVPVPAPAAVLGG